jgi:hypothetical protein
VPEEQPPPNLPLLNARSVARHSPAMRGGKTPTTVVDRTHVIVQHFYRQGDGGPLASGTQASSALPIAKAIALRSSWSPGARNPFTIRNLTSRS